jgi:hypothetical protein
MPSETCNRVRVERFFLEESVGEEKRETGLHIDGCPRCKEHLDFMVREKNAYLAVRPFTAFAAQRLEKRAPALGFLTGPKWIPALAGGLACLALVAVVRQANKGTDVPGAVAMVDSVNPGQDAVTYKGGESLEFHYRRDGKLLPGTLDLGYKNGDELQFVYSSGKYAYVSLYSVDAQGKVSTYRSDVAVGADSASASLTAVAGKLEPFPFSVTLDDAQGGELFVMVLSDAPLKDSVSEGWLIHGFKEAGGDLAKLRAALETPRGTGSVKTVLLKKVPA